MIDKSTLPYIDLGQDAETLRKYALEHFGKKISAIAKDETVVDRFQAIYEEETGVKLAPVDKTLGDDDDDDDEEKVAEQSKAAKPQPIAVTIIVQDDENDPGAICGSVNFVAYRIQRNKEARVSMPILESLRNAKKMVYNPDTMEGKEVIAYPFSIVEYHFEGDEPK